MNTSIYTEIRRASEQSILVIGGDRTADPLCARMALDIISARPERWCFSWRGRFVTRIHFDTPSASLETWADEHKIIHEIAELQKGMRASAHWGAIVLSNDKSSLEQASQCLEAGIPCIGVDTTDLDVFLLSQKNLEQWGLERENSQDNEDSVEIPAVESGLSIINVTESPFSNNSAMMRSGKMYEPVMASRDGDRCTLTRSQAGKAG
jgi:hypothetical protein